MASRDIPKLYRFHDLSSANIRKLYLMFIRAKLICPAVVTQMANKTTMKRLQRVQNSATLCINKTRRREQIRQRVLHQRQRLEPINIATQKLAKKVWSTMANDIIPEIRRTGGRINIFARLRGKVARNRRFPSTKHCPEENIEHYYT